MSTENGSPAARQPAAARLVEEIREAIKVGRFSPGHRLIEAELTREFGMSRGPVREALSRLEAEGLVETVPHRGAVVRQMTRKDVAEMFAVRQIVEGGAARLAAERIGEGDYRKRMRAQLTEANRWARTREAAGYAEANETFHNLIVEIAGNSLLAEVTAQLQTRAYRVLFLDFATAERVRRSSEQHRDIAKAILAGDGAAAEERMRAHIRTTAEATLALQHPWFR